MAAIQEAILDEMRRGGRYATANKEGGTNLGWHESHWVRADYGESDLIETFEDDASFLVFLRKFYDWETSRNVYPAKVSDFDAWKLIWRLMQRPSGPVAKGHTRR